ncbi:MAG: phosphoribosyl-AMP cyclohydrolase [Candidatus Omnitrophota bacterium]|jgi:phosphoribosyl-ATP pyrophosphohydrolase/phosphoribosyl-AMP cyclohydrolase
MKSSKDKDQRLKTGKNKISDLKFDEKGLIPAVIQDCKNGDVLMVAYMNKESLKITLKEKRTCFYSRSRKMLWRKGETSGHTQKVKSIYYDCDKDTLLVKVQQIGAACHTGEWSCFYRKMF